MSAPGVSVPSADWLFEPSRSRMSPLAEAIQVCRRPNAAHSDPHVYPSIYSLCIASRISSYVPNRISSSPWQTRNGYSDQRARYFDIKNILYVRPARVPRMMVIGIRVRRKGFIWVRSRGRRLISTTSTELSLQKLMIPLQSLVGCMTAFLLSSSFYHAGAEPHELLVA